jgi:hydroxymethylglutaryl-CoA lyase
MTGVGDYKIIECPRDAMQGWKQFIPTEMKVDYINSLLEIGFDTIDFGSFVSAKAIPQMADTPEVVKRLNLHHTYTRLLAIVANIRGAEDAVQFDQITYLGFPFSISPTFQRRNTNSTIDESLERVEAIQELCISHDKQLVLYLSMGFGNPYGDLFNEEILLHWADEMAKRDIKVISLADTIGVATPEQISFALGKLIPAYPQITVGVHLHSRPDNWKEKLEAAIQSGCKRIDGALKGIGGCPMAQDALIGNMNTELILSYLEQNGKIDNLNHEALEKSLALASKIFQ